MSTKTNEHLTPWIACGRHNRCEIDKDIITHTHYLLTFWLNSMEFHLSDCLLCFVRLLVYSSFQFTLFSYSFYVPTFQFRSCINVIYFSVAFAKLSRQHTGFYFDIKEKRRTIGNDSVLFVPFSNKITSAFFCFSTSLFETVF